MAPRQLPPRFAPTRELCPSSPPDYRDATHPPPQEARLDCAPGGVRLPPPDYRDATRTLRRTLRQLGGGYVDAGVRAVAGGEGAAGEVARLLGVEPEVRGGRGG